MNQWTVQETVNPMARSSAYRLLGMAFRYPVPELFEAIQDGDYFSALSETLAALPHLGGAAQGEAGAERRLRAQVGTMSFREFEVEYTRAFDVGTPEPPCPPYEGVYREGVERTALLIEVAEFYKTFGLRMSSEESKRELPDHLCAELEFLHFLAFKEAQAVEEQTPELLRGYLLAQKDFLERHLAAWLPRFSSKLQERGALPFFSHMARVASEFATRDLEWLRGKLGEPSGQ